jgi:hypothetical protein
MIFFKQGKPMRGGGKKPESRGEEGGFRTYEERMEEITRWNVEHTDILEVLRGQIKEERLIRGQIKEERLISWSQALSIGIRRIFKERGYSAGSPEYEALRDLDQFIAKQRLKLLGNPTMREAKGMEKMDPLSTCIISGIRVMQGEKELPAIMNTMKLKLLQRYLG